MDEFTTPFPEPEAATVPRLAAALPGRTRRWIRGLAPALALQALLAISALLAVPTFSAGPVTLAAQAEIVDNGTFLLSRNGEAVGTESFTIRRTGSGPNLKLVATGEVVLDLDGESRRISAALEASGPGSALTAYQLKEAGTFQTEIYMTLAGNRFQSRMVTPDGERVREHRAARDLVVLEQWVAHHYFLLASRITGASTTVPALIPRTGRQLDLQIADTGTERIQVAGQTVQARHLTVDNGDIHRDIWVDDQGRILLVVLEDTGFRAERRDLPD